MPYDVAATMRGVPNDLGAHWMPFTANRQFKAAPRLLVSADGMYFKSHDGREILDGTAGLWCCNAGHRRRPIVEAVQLQIEELDYAPHFQMGHPASFELANRLADMLPGDLDHVFFANSGSEAVDSALKIALAYHRVRGEGARTRLIGREKGYHGVGFGGISVGGMVNNRKFFGPMLAGVDHLPHTLLEKNRFTRGLPDQGVELADELERIVQLHDPSTIAAVIVEPISGSAGVILPPKGYLKRLREITQKYGILLIFDEVITGFGRLGASFAAEEFDVLPDLISAAKGITNGVLPMGAVFARRHVHDAFMQGPDNAIELFHGYTYSAHPVACAAALATLDVYRDDDLFARAKSLAPYWENAAHALKGTRHVVDIRNYGLIVGIELESRSGAAGARAYECFVKCYDKGVLLRTTGDTIAMSPPLIIEEAQIDRLFSTIAETLATID